MIDFTIEFDGSVLTVTQLLDGYTPHELFASPIENKDEAEHALEKLKNLLSGLSTNYQIAIDEASEYKLKELGITFQPRSIYKQIRL